MSRGRERRKAERVLDYREMKQALGLAHFEGAAPGEAGTTTSPSSPS
ncbi:hypothetical protein GCM10010211_71470 [Streptomyces albospinus]|uniref:Transposase n=1 Tax=Streptomyces albospinus TaxID=285515 RepID=A0ABQ2VN16_9ACTN|nr:hypothetical protein GCM10010211_71470 [Streptomyces albospinus]